MAANHGGHSRSRGRPPRTELVLPDDVRLRLSLASAAFGKTPSELASDILGRSLPEIPADYLAAVASVAG